MDKLIKLLNEFCKEKKYNTEWYEGKFGPNVKPYEKLTQGVVNGIIIGKHYGFIKWLVDNDKIDRKKVLISFTMSESDGLGNYYGHGVEKYQTLLMLLAISDTPTDDLILYLK